MIDDRIRIEMSKKDMKALKEEGALYYAQVTITYKENKKGKKK